MTSSESISPPSAARPARVVKSYVLRGGRIGSGQQRALAELGPRFVLPFTQAAPDWDAAFGRSAPRIVEIGFGMGQATAAIAESRPDVDFIGLEVHEAGVGSLLKLIGEKQLGNLRIVRHDAVAVLEQMVEPETLAGVHIYFPDPWPKKRHHKRRLVQGSFAGLLAARLAPGGLLHCATDWQPYAEQMLEVLSATPGLANTARGYAVRPPWRPLTRFESRGLKLGHGVWDLLFVKRST